MEGERPHTPRLAASSPWPGLEAYDEAGADYFHGRQAEALALMRCVQESPLTVLFGRSGLGKTSLLKAGLFPRLRELGYLPVLIRLDIRPRAEEFCEQIRDGLLTEVASLQLEAPNRLEGESLWETLHRADFELWSRQNYPLTPILFIDQFEELFTLGASVQEMVDRFRLALGDLAENRIPELVARQLEANPVAGERIDVRRRRFKLLISLREDYLAELESWSAAIPALTRVRYRLLPMGVAQALDAVFGSAAHLMDEALAERIVSFVAAEQRAQSMSGGEGQTAINTDDVAGAGATIEPALLSLFCRGLNDRRLQSGSDRFDDALLDSAKQGIIADYYVSCVAGLPERACRFIETELITEKGYRNNFAREDAVPAILSAEQLEQLISKRLLRTETRLGVQRIELTHDLLTRVVREHRDLRRAQDEKADIARRAEASRREEELRRLEAEARAGRRFRVLAGALLISLIVITWLGWSALQQRERAIDLADRAEKARERAVIEADKAAVAQADEARQRLLAEQRLARIVAGLKLKQAVLAGDEARIEQYLDSNLAEKTLRFEASARDLGYRGQSGSKIYEFALFPDPSTLREGPAELGLVTYWMNHPTFRESLMTAGPQQAFTARYTGWGCLKKVIALLEYVNPDEPPRIAQFDMCANLRSDESPPTKADRP